MPTSLDVAVDVLKWICVIFTTPITLQIECTKSGSVLHILLYAPSSLKGHPRMMRMEDLFLHVHVQYAGQMMPQQVSEENLLPGGHHDARMMAV